MNNCVICKADEVKEEDGICPYILGNDQLPLRCVGFWAKDKLFYLQKYMSIFNASMKGKWGKRAYIELFAGPGLGIIRNTGQIINGSPLIAIEQPIAFTRHIFVDINKSAVDSLEKRIRYSKSLIDVHFINGDCNDSVDEIRKSVDASFLILVFIDPTVCKQGFRL